MWIFFAFLAPALYAIAEIYDQYLSNRVFKQVTPIMFAALLLNFLFVPVLFIIQKPIIPSSALILPIIGLGLTNLLYLYPYYKSLKIEDTSIVSAFFSLGKIIIPIFAFLFIGEVLTAREYIGIGIIILGNILLGFQNTKGKIHISQAFYLILIASTILAIDGILYKYIFDQGVNWSAAVGGQLFISGIIGCVFLLAYPKTRREIISEKKNYNFSAMKLFFIEELFTFLALGAETLAISMAPVTLVKGIGMSIPIFILVYTVFVKKYKPELFHENTEKSTMIKKIIIFSLIILGLVLMKVVD